MARACIHATALIAAVVVIRTFSAPEQAKAFEVDCAETLYWQFGAVPGTRSAEWIIMWLRVYQQVCARH